ncbi:MAG: HEPN domain-containing protein [Desulfobacterales bacterium]|nr:MAG: HEPN domain-containing protein [Desulfobacterales bacterium]
MQRDEQVIKVVREWMEKAENDPKNAAFTLKMGEDCPTDTVCFHAQQCVEKYLKAFLTFKTVDFPKTHDMGELLALISESARPQLAVAEQRRLTAYATVTRYPGDYEPIPLAEVRRAVAIARRVRKEVRALLPKNALRERRK